MRTAREVFEAVEEELRDAHVFCPTLLEELEELLCGPKSKPENDKPQAEE